MLKRNAIPLALVLAAMLLWAVRPATGQAPGGAPGDGDDAPAAPSVEERLDDHAERLATLERMVGQPPRNAGSLDARIRATELEIDQLERDLEDAGDEGGGDGAAARRALRRDIDALTARVERIDRNRLAAIEREINNLERSLRDLNNRLRRIE